MSPMSTGGPAGRNHRPAPRDHHRDDRVEIPQIGPGRALPTVVTHRRQGDLTESLEELFLHVGEQALELPLDELNLLRGPFDEGVFTLLASAGLRRLGLLNTRALTSLLRISALPQLESLRLKNLTSLGDISELAALQRLDILNIQYCTKITGIAAINGLPRLRRLTLVGCQEFGLHTIEQKGSTLEWANTGAAA